MNAGSTVCDNRSEDGCCFSNFGQIFEKNRQAKREAKKPKNREKNKRNRKTGGGDSNLEQTERL